MRTDGRKTALFAVLTKNAFDMKSILLRYSLTAAGLLIALGLINWLLIARPLGYQAAEIVGYLSMIVALSVIYFAIRSYRTQFGHGVITFQKGFAIGIWITLITAALFGIYSVVYFLVWGDDFAAWAEEHFRTTLSAEEFEAYTSQVEQMGELYNNVFFQGLVMFLTVFFIGLIITLISALIQKNRG